MAEQVAGTFCEHARGLLSQTFLTDVIRGLLTKQSGR